MEKAKLLKQSLICFLVLGIVIIPILSGIVTTNATTTEYLQWDGSSQGVAGYLEITDFPHVLTIGETYKISAKFTVEELDYADAVEFGKIEWALQTPDGNYTIGYSFMDANLTKHQENSTISHWGLLQKPTSGGGRLLVIANIKLINSTEPTKTIQTISVKYAPIIILRVKSDLTMSPVISDIYMKRGSTTVINGTLTSEQGKTVHLVYQHRFQNETIVISNETVSAFYKSVITLEFTDPNGHKTARSINTNFRGEFSFKFTPNVTGTWFITANYNGSDYFLPSNSNIVIVQVGDPDLIVPVLATIVFVTFLAIPWVVGKLFGKQTKKIDMENQHKTGTKPPTHTLPFPREHS